MSGRWASGGHGSGRSSRVGGREDRGGGCSRIRRIEPRQPGSSIGVAGRQSDSPAILDAQLAPCRDYGIERDVQGRNAGASTGWPALRGCGAVRSGA